MSENTYRGRCFCGAVEVAVTRDPAAMGFCHCISCRAWSAAPINTFSLWRPEQVTVIRGEAELGVFNKTERSYRQFCRECGGHVMTRHPKHNFVDVYAAILPELSFEARFHVYYGERMISVPDRLPKFRDLPREFGGSGETVAE